MKFTEFAHFRHIGSVETESQKVHLWGKMRSKNEERRDIGLHYQALPFHLFWNRKAKHLKHCRGDICKYTFS